MKLKAHVLNQVKVLYVSLLITVPQPELRLGIFNVPAAIKWSVLCGTKYRDQDLTKKKKLVKGPVEKTEENLNPTTKQVLVALWLQITVPVIEKLPLHEKVVYQPLLPAVRDFSYQ